MIMDSSGQHVTIRLEVQVPIGSGAVVCTGSTDTAPKVKKYDATCIGTIPAAGTTAIVRPVTTSALAFLCAQATFSTAVFAVKGKVYVDLNPPPNQPPNGTSGQNPSGDQITWVWNDSLGNALPGVNSTSSPPFPNNLFAVWMMETSTSDWELAKSVTFSAQTGGTGPCGTPGSGSGSSSGSVPHPIGVTGTFPALWCVEISGFTGPRARLNNTYALRSNRAAAVPTWETQGDGESSPRLELRLLPQRHEWTLTVKLGNVGFTSQAFSHSVFGPLFFSIAPGTVRGASQDQPRIFASPA
jgi:hypothetical protein